jgi:hypothetical protein
LRSLTFSASSRKNLSAKSTTMSTTASVGCNKRIKGVRQDIQQAYLNLYLALPKANYRLGGCWVLTIKEILT